jgi:hypothetical protein
MPDSTSAQRLLLAFIPAGLVLIAHGVLSLGFDAYTRFPPLDIPVHLAGGMAISFALDACFALGEERSLLHVSRPLVRLLLLASLITSAATAWELVEFVSDYLFDTGAQKSLADTLSDIVFGVLGGTPIAAVLTLARSRREGEAPSTGV